MQAVLNLQAPLEYSKEVSDYKNLIKSLVMGTWNICLKPLEFHFQSRCQWA